MTGQRSLIALVVISASTIYLASNLVTLIQFAAMVGLILLPLAGIISKSLTSSGMPASWRVCVSLLLAMIALTPLYCLRRAIPLPAYGVDVLLMLALVSQRSAYRRFVAELLDTARPVWLLVGVVIPLIAVLVWTGFEVRSADTVSYYGLHGVDFSNLAMVTTLVKNSPGLPLQPIAEIGTVSYHWYFFAIPAWMSELAGTSSRITSPLMLSSMVAAMALVLVVATAVCEHVQNPKVIAIATTVALLAPMTTYAHLVLVGLVNQPWFSTGTRNNLLLSPVNSMAVFGNNTLAAAIVVCACAVLHYWNESRATVVAIVIAVIACALPGYSATLAFPFALAMLAALVLRQIQHPLRLILIGLPIGIVGLLVLRLTHVLGATGERPALSFDNGQFAINILFGMAPVAVGWLISIRAANRKLLIWDVLMIACLATPTFVALSASRSGDAALSMKIATLLAVASAPIIAMAVEQVVAGRSRWLQVISTALILAGLANTAAYIGQFPSARLLGKGSKRVDLPTDYHTLLDELRIQSRKTDIVLDAFGESLPDTMSTLLIAERFIWLPTVQSERIAPPESKATVETRKQQFARWSDAGFVDTQDARDLADRVDFVVLPASATPGDSWRQLSVRGAYSVYASAKRAPPTTPRR